MSKGMEGKKKRVITSFSVSQELVEKLDLLDGSSVGRSALAERNLWRYFLMVESIRDEVRTKFLDHEINLLRKMYPGFIRDDSTGLIDSANVEAALRSLGDKPNGLEQLIDTLNRLTVIELVALVEIIHI